MESAPSTTRPGFRRRMRQHISWLPWTPDRSGSQRQTPLEDKAIASPSNGLPTPNRCGNNTIFNSPPANRKSLDASAHPLGRATSGETHKDADINVNSGLQQQAIPRSSTSTQATSQSLSKDIWSAAFCEAINALGDDIDAAILQGKSVERVFEELERTEKNATEESAFLRGVQYLRSVKVPLENLKVALDLASPLTRLEPTATTVFGVVSIVTAIAISLASADRDFAKQVGDMLKQISYIDDCDTLGQKAHKKDIHQALVAVYKNILQFHAVAYDILTRKGMKLLIKMVLDKDRLPEIVADFLEHAATLQKLVQKATAEIALDIRDMLYDSKISDWLGGDKLARQGRYHADLHDLRTDQACNFLLLDQRFLTWYGTPGPSRLAILGNMGCGKTVAMAFIADELLRRNQLRIPQPKLCFCYCQDNETGRAAHILSVLLLWLLEQLPGLKKSFYEWYKQEQAAGYVEPRADTEKLGQFLIDTLESIDRPLYILIDGLDECSKSSQDFLLRFLRKLTESNAKVKTLIASRPEKQILDRLDTNGQIDLVSNLQRDTLIVEHITRRELSYLPKHVQMYTEKKLSHLAQGSAIWSKMVIELIGIRGIQEIGPMTRFLDTLPLPGELTQVYESLFARYTSNDPENQKLLDAALKLLATARRLLSILEIAWATALATNEGVQSIADFKDLVDPQRVLRLLHPFISRVDYDDLRKHQVQLVHQSLREYVFEMRASSLSSIRVPATSRATATGLKASSISRVEAESLETCIRYLLLNDVGQMDLFSDDLLAIEALPQEVDIFVEAGESAVYDPYCSWEDWEKDMNRYDPVERGFGEFFVYSSCYWTEHFGSIDAESLPSLTFVEKLCRAGSPQLRNWIEQSRRPDCTIKPRFLFESELYDPLSITSLYGTRAMLQHMVQNSDLDTDNFLPMTVSKAADQILRWGDPSKLKILLTNGTIRPHHQAVKLLELVIRSWSGLNLKHPDWDIVSEFFKYVQHDVLQEHARALLLIATEAHCHPVVEYLEDVADAGEPA